LFLATIFGLSACESVGFYSQVVKGHSQIMLQQEPIEQVVNNESTDEGVRRKLLIIKRARQFAVDNLKLPNNGSYTQYVDTGKRYVVWNVIATRPYSTRPIEHCFPVAGCVSYRGYYKKASAEAYAEKLKSEGHDVVVRGASAYSTLGWFSDPVLNTMLYRSDLGLAGLVFHELSHQEVYKAGDTAFNESFATTVELAGIEAWAKAQETAGIGEDVPQSDEAKKAALINQKNLKRYKAAKDLNTEVVTLILEHRKKLDESYRKLGANNDEEQLAEVKKHGFAELRKSYKQLRSNGGGSRGYDQWFAGEINNASLVLFGDYHGWVTAFDVLLQQAAGDWTRFYDSVRALAELDKAARREKLEALQQLAKVPGEAQ
jgi:predicted aminopeptidase